MFVRVVGCNNDADLLFHISYRPFASYICIFCLQRLHTEKRYKMNSKDFDEFMLVCNHSHIVSTSVKGMKIYHSRFCCKHEMHNNILLKAMLCIDDHYFSRTSIIQMQFCGSAQLIHLSTNTFLYLSLIHI